MRKIYLFSFGLILTAFLSSLLFAQDPSNFGTSLHKTREGKRTWYKQSNGGFENITNIPVENVNCLKCHPGTKADGTSIDPLLIPRIVTIVIILVREQRFRMIFA